MFSYGQSNEACSFAPVWAERYEGDGPGGIVPHQAGVVRRQDQVLGPICEARQFCEPFPFKIVCSNVPAQNRSHTPKVLNPLVEAACKRNAE